MSKITNDSLAQDALYLYSEGNSGSHRLITWLDIRVCRRNVTTVEQWNIVSQQSWGKVIQTRLSALISVVILWQYWTRSFTV